MRVLAINASPRKYGNTYKLLRVAIEASKYAGALVELIHLYDYSIKPCIGCVSDMQLSCRYPCLIDSDDGNKILDEIVRSDALIISTPIYWYGPSGHLKNLIDRMTSLENMIFVSGRSLLEGKVSGFIAVGADSGNIAAISYLMVVMNSMGVVIPPWALAYYLGQGDALENRESVLDAANLGFLVTRAALGAHPNELRYNPHLLEKLGGEELILKIYSEIRKLYQREQVERKNIFQNRSGRENTE
ncbi:MAG: flavodoxin family protein [Sulfolobales archaeon]|nr:flavodoxin family protein [Sulfolobales archaeon]MDW8083333.1 flavodoxin family protein [Sulfolobales archaeon]